MSMKSREQHGLHCGYEALGWFLVALAVLTLALHLLVRFHLLPKDQLSHPSDGLQIAVVLYLIASLYSVLRFLHHQPVLVPLGWVPLKPAQGAAWVGIGTVLGMFELMYQHFGLLKTTFHASVPLLLLAALLAPILEESLFRGYLLPLIATSSGSATAVIATAGVFALFHGPTDVAHWVSFLLTGVAYGWIRVASGTTSAPAMAHAAYNLILLLAAGA